jgi:hypothetical protein
MDCSAALDIGGRAFAIPVLKPIYGKRFGAGGYGGRFSVGRFRCYLHSRGSDFRDATCSLGKQTLRFLDQRSYWSTEYNPGMTDHVVSRRGYCFSGSLAADRDDAWRCFVGNLIYDPCFGSSGTPRVVTCPTATITTGTEIRLTRALPRSYANTRAPSINGLPWNIRLEGGQHCLFLTGATSVLDGRRLNYACSGGIKDPLWGAPNRSTEPWKITIGSPSASHLSAQIPLLELWY